MKKGYKNQTNKELIKCNIRKFKVRSIKYKHVNF
jgi:hypothetical protein